MLQIDIHIGAARYIYTPKNELVCGNNSCTVVLFLSLYTATLFGITQQPDATRNSLQRHQQCKIKTWSLP